VDGLAAAAVAVGHLDHREPVPQHLHDGVEALFCHRELQEHAPVLASPWSAKQKKGRRWCQPSTGTPERISRHHNVKHLPGQHTVRGQRRASNLPETMPRIAMRSTARPRFSRVVEQG
jgi:hypothetical protein